MTQAIIKKEFLALELDEQIELVGDLWDLIAADVSAAPLTPDQMAELDRRLAEHRADPGSAIPWEDVKRRLRSDGPQS